MTIKEKAKEYLMNLSTNGTFSLGEMIINAFIEGAKSYKPQWKNGSDVLPLVDGAQYIVKKDKEQHWCEICTWNETYQCWDEKCIKKKSCEILFRIRIKYC
jgi:hypothetical protein